MAITFNFSLATSRIQRFSAVNTLAAAQSMNQLSTGSKINSSKDNAANLQISNKLQSQIRGSSQSIQNAQAGINLLDIGERSLTAINETYQRIRELTLQAANGTLGVSQRSAINQNIQGLQAEIDRIAKTTVFSGKNIFDPQTVQVSGTETAVDYYSYRDYYDSTPDEYYAPIGDIDFTHQGGHEVYDDGTQYYVYFIEDFTGTGALSTNTGKHYSNVQNYSYYDGTYANIGYDDGVYRDVSGISLNTYSTSVDVPIPTKIQVGPKESDFIDISDALGEANIPVVVGGIGSTEDSARNFLTSIDNALTQLGRRTALFGTNRNKLENAISAQEIAQVNFESAHSRIRDVDFAKVTAKLTQNQVLQQFTTSLLSQANSSRTIGLSLLQSALQ